MGQLIVNVVGAFAIGFVQAVGLDAVAISDDTRLFLTTGIMGGLTTYSAFSYESVKLAEVGAWPQPSYTSWSPRSCAWPCAIWG